PALIALLKDPSPGVVQAAAEALEGLRDQLRAADPRLAGEISRALNEALKKTRPGTGAALREQLVAAMVAWASPEPDIRNTFVGLLRPNEPPNIRRLAVGYFGQMGSDKTWPADNIINSGSLEDRDPGVRRAAVEALGKVAQAENAEKLFGRLKPGELGPDTEPEARIRDEAWKALAAMFPREFQIEQLNRWADRFPDDPERRLTILEALRTRLLEKGNDADLAVVRQNIGEAYARLGQYGKAATEFDGLLKSPSRQGQSKEFLARQLLDAYLKGKTYDDATRFAAQMIGENPSYQTTLGPDITNEAERLHREGDAESALRLVTLALKMEPNLAPSFAERLRRIERDAASKVAPPPTSPAN
ncbi:MAG: HEAT repeat domain-containing protein, partial [Tepidisphaeraceae bacterium]